MKKREIEIFNSHKKLYILLLIAFISASLIACVQTSSVDNYSDKNIDQITNFAWEIINRSIENHELNPEVKIIDSKITRLELVDSFEEIDDKLIYVYALEYRLLPEDLTKVVMAGGMSADENGWLRETSSMGSPLLVISQYNDKTELLGIIWTGTALEEGGLEQSIINLLNSQRTIQD